MAVVAGAVNGTARGVDDHWPFAPMSQFAFRVDPDSEVRAAYLVEVTADGRRIRIPESNGSIGMNRAEVEGRLDRLVADPSGLQALAEARRRLHPDDPVFVRIELREAITRLRGGAAAGDDDVLRAEWDIR